MRATRNPIRRNRNIGTKKSGYGCNNKLVIPQKSDDTRMFWELLPDYKVITCKLNGKDIKFIVEPTKPNYRYCCTIEDIMYLLKYVPEKDISTLDLFVFRQPKRKEEILKPVWGRVDFSFDNGKYSGPAIIFEAIECNKTLYWNRKLDIASIDEIERLRSDGHKIINDKRSFIIHTDFDSTRSTQLYRTLLHEIGHWVHWQKVMLSVNDSHKYYSIPINEREAFAHRYAHELKEKLTNEKVLPFDMRPCEGEGIKQYFDILRIINF